MAVWPLIQKGFSLYLQKARKGLNSNFRGSQKDPLLYLGVFAILLFGFLVFKASVFFPQDVEPRLGHVPLRGDSFSNAKENIFIDENKLAKIEFPSFNTIQHNSLVSIAPPVIISPQVLGTLGDFDEEKKEILEYIVQTGDSLSLIAEKFNLSLNTLLWANDLNTNSVIQAGQKLVILPVSGVLHHVQKGETLSGIAEIHQGEVAEIISFNELSGEGIFIGDILIIPGGKLPPKPRYSSPSVPLASSYFIVPTQGNISQGLHWYNAVDLANECGSPIYSAAEGKVLRVMYGYNQGAGNYIKILHPNGVVTMYGHLQSILVNVGQSVSQGKTIALIGGKPGTPGAGRSTGCHLHFGVHGARNPFAG